MRRPGGLQASLECGGAPTRPGQRCMQRRQSGVIVCSQMLLAVRVNPSFAAPNHPRQFPQCRAAWREQVAKLRPDAITPLCTLVHWGRMARHGAALAAVALACFLVPLSSSVAATEMPRTNVSVGRAVWTPYSHCRRSRRLIV